jgi:hypothetical protein
MIPRLRAELDRLWRTDRALTAYGVVMLGVFVLTLPLIAADPRTIAGAPAWLKPAKFAISTTLYSLTLAWLFRFVPEWRRVRRFVSATTVAVFLVEIPLIDLQAWRGTTSHFNVATPFDAALFAIMGLAIVVQTAASAVLAVAVWRQRFADPAMGWALRAGLTITITGALVGGLMTRPTAAQLAEARATHRMVAAGAHTVGAPDGGAGLPGTGWSVKHGDLRVPHFAGLHAIQVLALVVAALRRRLDPRALVRVVQCAGLSYAALFAMLLWQALRGESLVAPSASTLLALAGWAVLTAASLWASRTVGSDAHAGPAVVAS